MVGLLFWVDCLLCICLIGFDVYLDYIVLYEECIEAVCHFLCNR